MLTDLEAAALHPLDHSRHFCVGFLFFVLYPVRRPSAIRSSSFFPTHTHNSYTHTTLSHTHTQHCHTHTHNIVTHTDTHTQVFTHTHNIVTQNSFTHLLRTLSHTTLAQNRSSTISFAFLAFPIPLPHLFDIIGRS